MKKHIYGLLASLAILLPNLILVIFPPNDVITIKDDMVMTIIEQIGRIGCVFFPAIIGIRKNTITKLDRVLIPFMLISLVATASIWILYVLNGRNYADLFTPVFGIHVPLAVIPSIYFMLLAVFMRSYLLGAFSLIFFIGHYLISNNVWIHLMK